jgi:hypothetical protein
MTNRPISLAPTLVSGAGLAVSDLLQGEGGISLLVRLDGGPVVVLRLLADQASGLPTDLTGRRIGFCGRILWTCDGQSIVMVHRPALRVGPLGPMEYGDME